MDGNDVFRIGDVVDGSKVIGVGGDIAARRGLGISATDRLSAEQVGLIHRVPYWMIDGRPRPSWIRRPVWRLRARRWSRV